MRYAKIEPCEYTNGEGVGTSLFVQGCHRHCKGCFNPETWGFDGGKLWTNESKKMFFDMISKPYISRVTILGGEPLADENIECVCGIIRSIKSVFQDTKLIWLYTGNTLSLHKLHNNEFNYAFLTSSNLEIHPHGADFFRIETIKCCDYIVDGAFDEKQKDLTLAFRGSTNQRIIDVQQSLKQGKVVLKEI